MLEVLEVLTSSSTPLRHNLMFLFNDGEESQLLGSTTFVHHHEWIKDVSAFINLEARGSGGRQLLFQLGCHQPWLIEAYRRAVSFKNEAASHKIHTYQKLLLWDWKMFSPTLSLTTMPIRWI